MWSKYKPFIISAAIALAGGGLSALLSGGMDSYTALNQPPLAPPGWVFPVAWSILYILMGISAALIYLSNSPYRRSALTLYSIQLIVNYLWPIWFFRLEARLFALAWLVLLLMLVIAMTIHFHKINRAAALLQLPYILWLLFAGYLNLGVYLLNG